MLFYVCETYSYEASFYTKKMSQEAEQEKPTPEFKDLTDEEYQKMTRKGLYKRAQELVDMITASAEKSGNNDFQMVIYIGLKNEAEKYLTNKKGQQPRTKQVERLVRTIYRNLLKKEDTKLDVEWVQNVVFQKTENIGVDRMYERLERVHALIDKFSEKQE